MAPEHNIIIVEDDPSMGLAIERLIHAAGWKARTLSSAEALLESDAAASADAFVLDVRLPGLSGFALHDELTAAGIKAPVVFITAQDRPWAQAQARRAGAVGYLPKPFSGQQLIEILNRHWEAA